MLKAFFIFMLLGFVAGTYQSLSQDNLEAGDIGQFVNSIFFLIALYGYAFRKAIIHRYFAIAIFLWNGVGYLVVTGFFIFMAISSSAGSFQVSSLAFLLTGYAVISFMMYVMFRYAFKSPDIWRKNNEKETVL